MPRQIAIQEEKIRSTLAQFVSWRDLTKLEEFNKSGLDIEHRNELQPLSACL